MPPYSEAKSAQLSAFEYGAILTVRARSSQSTEIQQRWDERVCAKCQSGEQRCYVMLDCCHQVFCHNCLWKLERCPVCSALPRDATYLCQDDQLEALEAETEEMWDRQMIMRIMNETTADEVASFWGMSRGDYDELNSMTRVVYRP